MVDDWNTGMECWWNDLDRRKPKRSGKKKKTVPSPLSTSNPICIGLGSNSAFRRLKLIQRISGQSCVTNSWYAQPRSSIENMTLVHRGIANKMQQCIKIFIWSSTCFGRHTAHHQELKTALAASGFAYVKGCWTCWGCWTLTASSDLNKSNNLSHMQNQRLLVQFWAPDDGRRVARNMLSFI